MRIFIAVCFNEEIKSSIRSAMQNMKSQGVIGNYTGENNLHMTLAFIGETDRLSDIKKAVSEVKFKPFEISLGEMGSFRDLLWLGVKEQDKLKALANSLRKSLTKHGIEYDRKAFKPHITLCRRADVPTGFVAPAVQADMTVNKISIMKSERIKGRLIYTEL